MLDNKSRKIIELKKTVAKQRQSLSNEVHLKDTYYKLLDIIFYALSEYDKADKPVIGNKVCLVRLDNDKECSDENILRVIGKGSSRRYGAFYIRKPQNKSYSKPITLCYKIHNNLFVCIQDLPTGDVYISAEKYLKTVKLPWTASYDIV